MRGWIRTTFAVTLCTLVLAEAFPAGAQVRPPPRLEGAGRETPARQFRTADEQFVHLASVVPGGFGGLFWDEQGRPNVYLLDPSKRAGAVTAVATSLRGQRVSLRQGQGPKLNEIQILQGQYDFLTLLRWREQLDQAAARISGLVMLDADERRNRVLVGVETAEAEQQVRDALGPAGIPAEGVIIERRERPPMPMQARVPLWTTGRRRHCGPWKNMPRLSQEGTGSAGA